MRTVPIGMIVAAAWHAALAAPPAWQVVASPVLPGGFTAISAVASDDIFAVGFQKGGGLAEHWNGTAWKTLALPKAGAACGLSAVAAISGSDAWAAGYCGSDYNLLHWDGSTWTKVAAPYPCNLYPSPYLAAIASDDVWLMGSTHPVRGCTDSGLPAFAMHWNGHAWRRVTTPTHFAYGVTTMTGIAASGPQDVWAVGVETTFNASSAVALHWDGAAWSEVATSLTGYATLYGVAATAPNDAWAAGADDAGPLALHWDGTAWHRLSLPAAIGPNAIAATGATDAWVVGSMLNAKQLPLNASAHWNGMAWRAVTPPTPRRNGALAAMAALPGGTYWAVGSDGPSNGSVIKKAEPLALKTGP